MGMGGKRRRFTREFKEEAVRLASGADSIRRVARELGLGQSTLVRWVNRGKERASQQSSTEPEEVQRLQRELERVREERDILKKAVAFFAKENK